MKIHTMLKRIAALGLLSATIAGLAGCGGGGGSHGSSATPADKAASAFRSGNFEGSFGDSAPGLRAAPRVVPPTQCKIQFNNNAGVASFYSGTAGSSDFRTYSADIANIDFQISSQTSTTVSGTIDFDMTNFTAQAFFSGTAHYHGAYQVTAGTFALSAFGQLTGKDAANNDVSFNFGISYQPLLQKINLAGNYTGTIVLPNATGSETKTWTGSLTKVDDLHLTASVTTSLGTISFNGQNSRTSFAGSFDAGQINVLLTGKSAQWYLKTTDNGATLDGGYVVLDSDGTIVVNPLTSLPVFGAIHAVKATSTGGGGGSAVQLGLYEGGIIRNSLNDGRIMKLSILHSSATSGANGAMVIVTGNGGGPNIGGRVASVVTNDTGVTITIDQITNTYSSMVLQGTVNGTTLDVSYTATLNAGGTETGSFDALGKISGESNAAPSGSWTGTATSDASGHPTSTFTATFVTNGNGTLTITPTSTVGGGNEPSITLPSFTAFVAGASFAGHVDKTISVPSLGGSFPATVVGDFDGDVGSTAINGDYLYSVTAQGETTPAIADSGTLLLHHN